MTENPQQARPAAGHSLADLVGAAGSLRSGGSMDGTLRPNPASEPSEFTARNRAFEGAATRGYGGTTNFSEL